MLHGDSAPEGRQNVATGVSPWTTLHGDSAPEGRQNAATGVSPWTTLHGDSAPEGRQNVSHGRKPVDYVTWRLSPGGASDSLPNVPLVVPDVVLLQER